ncbi:MAG: cbb3-type cytochrome c oxidase subunit I [Verrucomicrobiota bacterium]
MAKVIDKDSKVSEPNKGKPVMTDAERRAAIDKSCRTPVLLFMGSAIFWLLAGTTFGLLASFKLHDPQFFNGMFGVDFGFLNFGRVRPAHLNAVAYGWASAAALGVAIWLMARLCHTPLRLGGLVCAAGVFWNIGMVVGIVSILAGYSTSIEWLEFPAYATLFLFISYALVAIWAVDMFLRRKPGHVYVSQWYIIAALFWFPWLYGTANIAFLITPVAGSAQGIINWWYGHNALGLWFTPIGLAAAYYFIPKVIGRPVHSYYLSAVGFWALALFYSWNGGHHLIGGPLPAWVITASIVASVMMVIPVVVTAVNHHMTVKGNFHILSFSPTLRFIVFGAMSYTIASLQGSSMAIRSLNEITHFTDYTIGHAHLGLYAFFTMIMFGSFYYIVPRLVDCEWRSAALIKIHFWCCAYGIIFMVGTLTIGGLVQGFLLADANVIFERVVDQALPYRIGRSLSGLALAVGHIAFAIHFVLMLLNLGRKTGGPTYFRSKW